MKNYIFKIWVALGAIVVVFFGVYCFLYKTYKDNMPIRQKGTVWVSEDKKIIFSVPESGSGIGTIQNQEGEIVEILFCTGHGKDILIYYEADLQGNYIKGEPIEHWQGKYYKKDEFIAIVDETTYFEKGQKIKFNKIE